MVETFVFLFPVPFQPAHGSEPAPIAILRCRSIETTDEQPCEQRGDEIVNTGPLVCSARLEDAVPVWLREGSLEINCGDAFGVVTVGFDALVGQPKIGHVWPKFVTSSVAASVSLDVYQLAFEGPERLTDKEWYQRTGMTGEALAMLLPRPVSPEARAKDAFLSEFDRPFTTPRTPGVGSVHNAADHGLLDCIVCHRLRRAIEHPVAIRAATILQNLEKWVLACQECVPVGAYTADLDEEGVEIGACAPSVPASEEVTELRHRVLELDLRARRFERMVHHARRDWERQVGLIDLYKDLYRATRAALEHLGADLHLAPGDLMARYPTLYVHECGRPDILTLTNESDLTPSEIAAFVDRYKTSTSAMPRDEDPS